MTEAVVSELMMKTI